MRQTKRATILILAILTLCSCTQGGSGSKPPVLPDIQITPGGTGNGNTGGFPQDPPTEVYPSLPSPGVVNPLFAPSSSDATGLSADMLVSGNGSQAYIGRLIGKGAEGVSAAAIRFTIQKDSSNTLHFTKVQFDSMFVLPYLDASKNVLLDTNNQPTPYIPQLAGSYGPSNRIDVDDARKRVGRATVKFDGAEKGFLNARILASPDHSTLFITDSQYALIAQKAASFDQAISDMPTSEHIGTFNLSHMDWVPGTDIHVSQGKWEAVQIGGSHSSGFTRWKRSIRDQKENGLGNVFDKTSAALVFRTFLSGSTQSEYITHIFVLSQDRRFILSLDNTDASAPAAAFIGQRVVP